MLSISPVWKTILGGGSALILMAGCSALPSSSEDSTASESAAESVTESVTVTETITETSARSRSSAAPASTSAQQEQQAQQEAEGEPTISLAQRCDMDKLRADVDWVGGLSVLYCDESFARYGRPNTGSVHIAHWSGDSWHTINPDGKDDNDFSCYSRVHLEDLGLTADQIQHAYLCEGT
ncbi:MULTISPECIES: hypothetical protein [Corynebacterium]|uniref:hypothetical protein n=1 Tax=Corynebacterium TaxID=1716 RepID=UPI00124F056F|nr:MULTISPECIES: hypothetical protein [Corynebacterium]